MLIRMHIVVWILITKQVHSPSCQLTWVWEWTKYDIFYWDRDVISTIFIKKSSVLSFWALSIYHLPHFIWQMSWCGPSFGSGNCHCLYELNKRNIINRMYAIPLLCTYVNCVLLLSKILFPIFVYTKQEKRSISRGEPSLACKGNNGWYQSQK